MDFLKEMSVPALFAILVGLTNILTEVTKRVLALKKAEVAVVFWAVSLTAAAVMLKAAGSSGKIQLLAAASGIIGGGVVAYAAMFGYDALYERLPEALRVLVGYLNGREENHAQQP